MADDWIKDAVKRPGALRAKAKAAGELNKEGNIRKGWIDRVAENKGDKYSAKTEKQAELAKTFAKMRK